MAWAERRREESVYRSPLLRRFDNDGRITMEQMRAEVPIYQRGHQARLRLQEDPAPTGAERVALLDAVRAGEQCKERLLAAGIPLVKSLAVKEYNRRQGWATQVTFEDLFQDALLGYFRALLSYKVDGDYKSPTNFIGQWIITEMRRSAETLDNDFEVSHESSERFRRIRAIRSRLSGELGRPPTDEEIMAASLEATAGHRTMGRVGRSGPKPLTAEQIEEERLYRHRVGVTHRIVPTYESGESDAYAVSADWAQPVLGSQSAAMEDSQDDRDTSVGLSKVFTLAMDAIGMPDLQRQIVWRRFGLSPFTLEEDVKDIARALSVSQQTVNDVLDAFRAEMGMPGGAFHQVCATLPADVIQDAGLGWVLDTLGEFTLRLKKAAPNPAATLTGPLRRKPNVSDDDLPTARLLKPGTYAKFVCRFHGRAFVLRYRDETKVPPEAACASCGRPSPLHSVVSVDT